MTLVIPIVATLVLVTLGLVGYWRDTRRGILALAGTLLGAILVGFWGALWAQDLAKRFGGGDPRTLTFVVSCTTFLFAVLFIGYGGGLLLRRSRERASLSQRLVGALLGLLNGALIIGYMLRFAANQNPNAPETLLSTPVARAFHDGLPLLFLGIAVVVAVLVLVRGLLLIAGVGRVAPAKPVVAAGPKGIPSAASAKPATPQDRQREIMEKIEKQL
jgi:Na+-transporting methylmalonyl-CoA/oxaloacetate decarboxylase gamma subunit/uncharacterized membrane protein required for colicin V production